MGNYTKYIIKWHGKKARRYIFELGSITFAATKLKAELKRKSLFAFKMFVSVVQN